MSDEMLIGMFFVLGALMLWHIIDDIAWRIRRWRFQRRVWKRIAREIDRESW